MAPAGAFPPRRGRRSRHNGVKESMNQKTLSAAFQATIPVLMGYLAIGMAFGLMMDSAGYHVIWTLLMSLLIYAGAGQYLGVTLLVSGASPAQAALMTLLVNFRHMFYGLSMLEKFRGMGLRKLYMIFSLTDETYALLASAQTPEGVQERDYYLAIALLNQSYWVLGSALGGLLGSALSFDTTGVDFAMTALFLVIAVGQWKGSRNHLPAAIGALATLVSLQLVGKDNMLIPALAIMVAVLLALAPRMPEGRKEQTGGAEKKEGAL